MSPLKETTVGTGRDRIPTRRHRIGDEVIFDRNDLDGVKSRHVQCSVTLRWPRCCWLKNGVAMILMLKDPKEAAGTSGTATG